MVSSLSRLELPSFCLLPVCHAMLPGGFVPNLGEYQTARMGMVASDQVVWLGAELPKRQVVIGFVAGWPACRHRIFFSAWHHPNNERKVPDDPREGWVDGLTVGGRQVTLKRLSNMSEWTLKPIVDRAPCAQPTCR